MPHLHLMPLLGVPVEILIKIAIFHAAPAFDAPVRGPHRNTAIMLCMEKLEWCGYPMVKKMENVFTRFYYYYYYYYYTCFVPYLRGKSGAYKSGT